MKRLIPLVLVVLVALFSCNEKAENDGKTTVVHDSMATVLPTWQALKVKVSDDKNDMLIVVGDATLYKASDEVKKQKAEEVAKMVLRIYGPNNYLEKGKLIITADIKNEAEAPADGITLPLDFAAMKKAGK